MVATTHEEDSPFSTPTVTVPEGTSIINRVRTWIYVHSPDWPEGFGANLIALSLDLNTQQVHSALSTLNSLGEITRLGDGKYSNERHEPTKKKASKQKRPRGAVIGPVRDYVKYLRGEFSPKGLAEALDVPGSSVHSALNNLQKTGEVKRVGDGRWVSTSETFEAETPSVDSGDMFEVVGHSNGRILVRHAVNHEILELRELS